MADATAAALGAIVGICAALIICVIALIVFVIVFCNLKIKNDNNIRKRLLAKDAFDEEKTIEETQPVIRETIYPQPPAPVVVPPAPTPVPSTPVLPRVLPPPKPAGRSRSWGAATDDWMLVKKITRNRRSSGDSSSSEESSDDEHHHRCRKHHHCQSGCNRCNGCSGFNPLMMSRLAPYDLATPMMLQRPTVTPTVTPFVVQPFMA